MYTRLARLGVSVFHTTSMRVVKRLGENHDMQVQQWKAASEGRAILTSNESDKIETASSEMGSNGNSDNTFRPLAIPLPPDPTPQEPAYVIVGNNLDKNVSPKDISTLMLFMIEWTSLVYQRMIVLVI